MIAILIALLAASTSPAFAESTEPVSVAYDCTFLQSSGQVPYRFMGDLVLRANALFTNPAFTNTGAINTPAGKFHLYLMRDPNDLGRVDLIAQTGDNLSRAISITPGVTVSMTPMFYFGSVERIKRLGFDTFEREINAIPAETSGTLTCVVR